MATVVIVEDEDRVREVVATILKRTGYKVLSFPNPGPELYAMDFDTIDLIIMDLAMPTRGEEAIYTLRSSGITVPLIILSAFVQESDDVSLKAIGADRVLSKPCTSALLLDTIRELLAPG
jgi:two-component system response regulator ResD